MLALLTLCTEGILSFVSFSAAVCLLACHIPETLAKASKQAATLCLQSCQRSTAEWGVSHSAVRFGHSAIRYWEWQWEGQILSLYIFVVVLQGHIFYKCYWHSPTAASFEGLSFPVVAYLVFKTLRLFNALHRNPQYTAIMWHGCSTIFVLLVPECCLFKLQLCWFFFSTSLLEGYCWWHLWLKLG